MNLNKAVNEEIDRKAPEILAISDDIWKYAELSLSEEKSCKRYVDFLRAEGFTVEAEFCGIKTAFEASFGSGSPKIGILAEYDALAGLSQVAASAKKEIFDEDNDAGHGCGHNMLGAGALAAALGVKAYLEQGHTGTLVLFGCPGEEGWASKAYMAGKGVFSDLDLAITWHPEDVNKVCSGSSISCLQYLYKFSGTASHAAAAPHMGRSALDAVELMNTGVQYLREHVPQDTRIHYSIVDTGGTSPNVVQSHAASLYMIRSHHIGETVKLKERVDNIARGAALMTDTTVEIEFVDGLSDTVPCYTLEKVMQDVFEAVGGNTYTDEEMGLAGAVRATYEDEKASDTESPMYQGVKELVSDEIMRSGSTDVGDVSWICPTVQAHVAAWPINTPAHSWQSTSMAGSSIGHKAVILAGKVIAQTFVALLDREDVIEEAKKEHKARVKALGGYVCPFPKDAKPELKF